MVAIEIDLNTGRNLKICLCLEIYSSKVYIGFMYVFGAFMCFTLPELLLSLRTKKEIDTLRPCRNLKDEAMQYYKILK